MLRNHPIRTGLMLISLAVVLMTWSLAPARAGGPASLHVLFTGGANANLEPSG